MNVVREAVCLSLARARVRAWQWKSGGQKSRVSERGGLVSLREFEEERGSEQRDRGIRMAAPDFESRLACRCRSDAAGKTWAGQIGQKGLCSSIAPHGLELARARLVWPSREEHEPGPPRAGAVGAPPGPPPPTAARPAVVPPPAALFSLSAAPSLPRAPSQNLLRAPSAPRVRSPPPP